jgi:hypothetical protein
MEIEIKWWHFGLAVAISAIGFHTALTTDVGERPPAEEAVALIGFRLRRYARNGGWILGIGGLMGALRVFFTLF